MKEDLELFSAWQCGDRDAGDRLCRRYDGNLRRLFGSKVPAHDVDELIQQTWLAMTQTAQVQATGGDGSPRIRTTFRAYLFGVARHIVFNYHRRQHRNGGFDPEVDSVESLVPSLSRQLSLARKVKQLELALQSLPLELQLLAEARYVEELTGPELADAFGIPEGTVRSRLSRARRLLDEALARWRSSASTSPSPGDP